MKLVVLHHHLNPGGVTRVIENQLRALATCPQALQPSRVVVMHGGRAELWPQDRLASETPFELTTSVLPDLDYQEVRPCGPTPLPIAIRQRLESLDLSADSTILHWHNHSLGKNRDVPFAVAELAGSGYRTLLQIHDFAEDFRPENYRSVREAAASRNSSDIPAVLYPQAAAIHYAALNGRDRSILAKVGVPGDRLHLLPNPVAEPPVDNDPAAARGQVCTALALPPQGPLIVYPVRGIRRKNIGEFLLWSAVHPMAAFVLTLAPKNPAERASFDRWVELARKLGLTCRLGVPSEAGVSYAQLLAASDALITTSVAEGFGMTFLECWLADRRLLGRNLTEITSEFVDSGVDLGELASRVSVPVDWIDREKFRQVMHELCRKTYAAMGVAAPSEGRLLEQFDAMFDCGIDFAQLPSSLQRQVVQRVAESTDDRNRLLALNPKLRMPETNPKALIAKNAEAVQRHYSIESIGDQLADVYRAVYRSNPVGELQSPSGGEAALHNFLSPARLCPVRIET